jgi:hypothetical protein
MILHLILGGVAVHPAAITGLFSDPACAAEVKLQRGRILFAQPASLE